MTNEIIKSPYYILFVDDEENARKYFDKGLRHMFNILTAGSVDEAIKIINERHKDIAVVIADQRMPGGNGIKLLRFLRENHPPMVRLLTTAYSDLTEAIEAVNTGEIFRYIQKPWDYEMLKTELSQAMEVFALRLERFKLVSEKIMVKRKMAKIERAKALILIAKTLAFIRFSNSSMQNFIRKFADVPVEPYDKNWNSFDFGKSDILETQFLLTIVERLQAGIPISADYSSAEDFNYDKILALVEGIKPQSLQFKISDKISDKINEKSLSIILKNLVKVAGAPALLTIESGDEHLAINLQLEQFEYPQNSNIFIQNPEKPVTDFYMNLMICYLMTGHHGGTIDLNHHNKGLNCVIKLPYNNRRLESATTDSDASLENTILTALIS